MEANRESLPIAVIVRNHRDYTRFMVDEVGGEVGKTYKEVSRSNDARGIRFSGYIEYRLCRENPDFEMIKRIIFVNTRIDSPIERRIGDAGLPL